MEEIIALSETINKTVSITDKIKLIKNLNSMIEDERNKLNYIYDQMVSNKIINCKQKIPLKYKKLNIEELEELFNKTEDINDKISIYLAIERAYTNISDELFITE